MNRASGFRGATTSTGVPGNWTVGGNLSVTGSSSLDSGGITTDGAGNLTVNGALLVNSSTSLDGGLITTDGSGNMAFTAGATISSTGTLTLSVPTGFGLSIPGSGGITTTQITCSAINAAVFQFGATAAIKLQATLQNTNATLSTANAYYRATGSASPTWTAPTTTPTNFTMFLENMGTGTVTLTGWGASCPTSIPSGGAILVACQAPGTWLPKASWRMPFFPVPTSGALSTTTFSSGVGKQISTTQKVETMTPITFNPTALATATCLVELSPDGITYSTIGTEVAPAIAALAGEVRIFRYDLAAGWYLRLTPVNATIGTTTYVPAA